MEWTVVNKHGVPMATFLDALVKTLPYKRADKFYLI